MTLALILFFIGHCVSMTYTSIFYHRGLCHGGLVFPPFMIKFIASSAMWVTGIDAKAWVCMHRLHHQYSDTEKDPHSPLFGGFWYTFLKSHKSFSHITTRLILGSKRYNEIVKDIPFDVHWLNKKGLWWFPFLLHFVIGILISVLTATPLAGVGYFLGIAGHPVQGFLVNAVCHAYGYRNYNCPDQSRNNLLVAATIFGEGYHNNHHQFPSSPKFSVKPSEFDVGYLVINIMSWFGLVKILKNKIPDAKQQLNNQAV